ncbi:MAG: YdcF family protein [Verrucomicrobiota bacterium]
MKRLGLGLAILTGLYLWTAFRIWTYTDTSERESDAAIVLGGYTSKDRPSGNFAQRIDQGIALYKQGRVGKLIMTGGITRGEKISCAEAAVVYAAERGVPLDDMLIENRSRYTTENLAYAEEIGTEAGLNRFLIVSDPLHMKRVMRIARRLKLDARPSPTPTPVISRKLAYLERETRLYLFYVCVVQFVPVRPQYQ